MDNKEKSLHLRKLKKFIGSTFFTVTFLKKDGSERTMNARLGVSKHVKGTGEPKDVPGLLTVYEIINNKTGHYRSLYVDKIQEIKVRGSIIRGEALKRLLA